MDLTAGLVGPPLAALAFAFVLVLCRCGSAVMLLPGLGEEEPPAMFRVGAALALAALITPLEAAHIAAPPASFLRLAAMVACECLAGGLLGWLARLMALALPAAGQLISLMTGLSSILQPDPVFGAQTAATGRLFGVAAPALILASGLYALPLSALAGSYAVFPPGALPNGTDLTETATRAVSAHFALALRLASPFILVNTVWQVALGLMSRLVPQIQIYFAALPGQVLGGLLLLAVLAGAVAGTWLEAVRQGFATLPGL